MPSEWLPCDFCRFFRFARAFCSHTAHQHTRARTLAHIFQYIHTKHFVQHLRFRSVVRTQLNQGPPLRSIDNDRAFATSEFVFIINFKWLQRCGDRRKRAYYTFAKTRPRRTICRVYNGSMGILFVQWYVRRIFTALSKFFMLQFMASITNNELLQRKQKTQLYILVLVQYLTFVWSLVLCSRDDVNILNKKNRPAQPHFEISTP